MTPNVTLGFAHYLSFSEQGGRSYQEDYLMPQMPADGQPLRYAIVCDGMGGHAGGDVASRLVAQRAAELLDMLDGGALSNDEAKQIVREGRKRLYRYAETENPFASNMGTTLAAVYHEAASGHVVAFHCGDSRIYHIRDGKIIWRSTDHSYVQHLVDAGSITPEEALNHRGRHILMRSISLGGEHDTAKADVHRIEEMRAGDCLLLCSDGVYDCWSDSDMETFLAQFPDTTVFFDTLRERAKEQHGDNYSAWLLTWSPIDEAREAADAPLSGEADALVSGETDAPAPDEADTPPVSGEADAPSPGEPSSALPVQYPAERTSSAIFLVAAILIVALIIAVFYLALL